MTIETVVHAENGIGDFARCGARLVWWEDRAEPLAGQHPASTRIDADVTCRPCLARLAERPRVDEP